MASDPDPLPAPAATAGQPAVLVHVEGLSKSFTWRSATRPWQQQKLTAIAEVDLDIWAGECFALVGESGSGKSTLARCLVRLLEPDRGRIFFAGEDLLALDAPTLRRRRAQFQLVFQDAGSAFNPRFKVQEVLAEPLILQRRVPQSQIEAQVAELLLSVGLAPALAQRFPHQLSGGQRQRVGLARALATEPRLLVLDEPVSALDLSVRAQILELLLSLRQRLALTLIFISHDLAVVRQVADRVGVFYAGRLVELALREQLFARPQHPYTVSLLWAVPTPDPVRQRPKRVLKGEAPNPLTLPAGCAFHPRCPIAQARCQQEVPALRTLPSGQRVACHFPGELAL